jgi:ABC-type bacteriocin/lantibiotic exporter with double-glycine peptidase domain
MPELLPPCLRSADAAQSAKFSCVEESIAHFTNILLILVAIGAFLYLLYGAFLYVSAFGDEAKVNQGKKTITYALIGVIIASLAAFIVQLLRDVLQA